LVPVPPAVVGVAPPPPEGVVAVPADVGVPALGVVPVTVVAAAPPVVLVAVAAVVPVVVAVVELDELELLVEAAAAEAVAGEVGTVKAGAPETSGVPEPPPPHALRPRLRVRTASVAGRRVR
jgi:hypothetical protein